MMRERCFLTTCCNGRGPASIIDQTPIGSRVGGSSRFVARHEGGATPLSMGVSPAFLSRCTRKIQNFDTSGFISHHVTGRIPAQVQPFRRHPITLPAGGCPRAPASRRVGGSGIVFQVAAAAEWMGVRSSHGQARAGLRPALCGDVRVRTGSLRAKRRRKQS